MNLGSKLSHQYKLYDENVGFMPSHLWAFFLTVADGMLWPTQLDT